MAECCQLLGFSTLLQHAVRLIKGIDIHMSRGVISVSVFSIISWFKVSGAAAPRTQCRVVLLVLLVLLQQQNASCQQVQ